MSSRSNIRELQVIKLDQAEQKVNVKQARFGFVELLEVCRQPVVVDKDLMDEPAVLDSAFN